MMTNTARARAPIARSRGAWRIRGWRAALIALLSGSPGVAEASQPLKVYISADMEGVAGLVANSQFAESGTDYGIGRRLLMGEVNAAIAGAFDAGATEVVVNDAHGSQMNIIPDELDPRASLVSGAPKPLGMMEGIASDVAAVVFVGYHARASTGQAVMDHSFSGNLKSIRIDGREVGEFGLNTALAGYFRVPVVFVSGDRALTKEAKNFAPAIVAVAVKDGIATTAARSMSPLTARQLIRNGVKEAVQARAGVAVTKSSSPTTLEVELARPSQAELAMKIPRMERASARAVRYRAADILEAYKVTDLIMLLVSLDHL